MKWILLFLIFAGSTFMIFRQKIFPQPKQEAPQLTAEEILKREVLPEKAATRQTNDYLNPEIMQILYGLAGDPNDKLRWMSVELLYRSGADKSPGIVKSLISRESKSWIKLKIIDMLGQYKDRQSLSLLALAQNDIEPEIRMAALNAISSFHTADVIPLLTKSMKDSDSEVQLKAMESFKNLTALLDKHKQEVASKITADREKKKNRIFDPEIK